MEFTYTWEAYCACGWRSKHTSTNPSVAESRAHSASNRHGRVTGDHAAIREIR